MISLQTLLASKWLEKLPLIGIILVGLIVLSIFISGMRKGLIGAGKGGIIWAITGVAFVLLYKFVPNPIKKGQYKGTIWGGILIVAIVVAVLLVCVLFDALFAPKSSKPQRARASRGYDEDEEYEYDLDEVITGRYSYSTAKKTKYEIERETSPGILARFLGGVTSIVNFAIILAIVAAVGLLIVDMVTVSKTIEQIIKGQPGKLLSKYIMPYLFDFLAVCIILILGRRGFFVGTIGFTRILFLKLGILTAVIVGFAAPFFKAINSIELIDVLIDRCGNLYKDVKFLSNYNGLLGQLTVGALFAIIGTIVMVIINIILKQLMEMIEDTTVLRIIDGVLATFIYLALGIALCGILWGSLYLLDYYKIFRVQEVLKENTFSYECFNTAGKGLKWFAEKYLSKVIG